MTLPNSSSTIAVPYRSTARIVAGDAWLGETPAAWITPTTSPSDAAVSARACTDVAVGDVDGCGRHVEAGVAEDLGRGVGVLDAQVGEHDVLAGADSPGDRLTDRAGADDDDDFVVGRGHDDRPPGRAGS